MLIFIIGSKSGKLSYVKKNVWVSSKFTLRRYIVQFLFHLEGKLPVKTVLKFQQYYPIVNKVKYHLPILSTVEN